MTDLEIARANVKRPVADVARDIGLPEGGLELYGAYKAKVSFPLLRELQARGADPARRGRLVLVTAMTPTPAGEGKSTVTIALGDALRRIGKKAVIALREPSLGPCFGVKGGACGGGYAQVVPMEEINLHFTGDIHAITAANNLMAALIDNHIQQGNALGIDPRTITWKRCVDLNDRALRTVVLGLGGRTDGVPRESHFQISVASEVMAVVCLSRTLGEVKERISRVTVGETYGRRPVAFGELGCTGAVAALLRDAVRPNLVQTLEHTPAFVHGGPFANIAHGCNSVNATLCALATGDYAVTEAGFAADLGAEKFFDIKCRQNGLEPSAAVIVATVRALKMHGGVPRAQLGREDVGAVERGFCNLRAHVENVRRFGVPAAVAVNRFAGDSEAELAAVLRLAAEAGARAVVCEGWGRGGAGAEELARVVAEMCEEPSAFAPAYPLEMPLADKVSLLATRIYRAGSVAFGERARAKLKRYEDGGFGRLPVCMAKTQNSISHDRALLGAPSGYVFPVRDAQLFSGAGFVVAFAGDVVDMPGLPEEPAAMHIDVDDDGVISGLF